MLEKIKKLTDMALTAGFLGFIFLVMVMTYTGEVKKSIADAKFNFASYTQLSDRFESVLQKNIYKKYGFINLNGRITRIFKINSLNNVLKLNNGFLAFFDRKRDISVNVEKTAHLKRFLEEKGIYFLYILAPIKNSMYDVEFAPGYGDESRQNLINMVDAMNAAGITNINMDEWFKKNNWHMKDVFFKTDHHWKPQAGLAAARCTMEMLQQQGVARYDKIKLQNKSYKIKVLKNWLLGSQGQRVGKYYGGVDDISVYYPKFKIEYSSAILLKTVSAWGYWENIINEKLMETRDYFGLNPYMIYLGGGSANSNYI